MFLCMREPMSLSINVERASAFLQVTNGTHRYFLHVFPSASVCGRALRGRQLAYLPGWEPSSEPRRARNGLGEALLAV